MRSPGLVGSLGLEVLAAVGLEWRDPVIASAQGLEGLAGVGVLGSLPRIS